ncbi:DPP IV N-terminal domain-containing protein [Horticoccus sp. 23ND18S-11]|uniref:DPP IV N-terminal domain-containing protein n=1 Tax=Horticoccus sp. 23ND18S-11 TaxID=3391832 RepID=UPI0039C8DB67
MRFVLPLVSLFVLLLSPGAAAEPTPKIYRARVEPVWLGETACWYRNDLPGGRREFIVVDAAAGTRTPAFDASRLPDEVQPIEALEFAPARDSLVLHGRTRSWRLDLASYTVREDRGGATALPVDPDARAAKTSGLFVINRSGGPLTLHRFVFSTGSHVPFELAAGARLRVDVTPAELWLVNTSDGRTRAVWRAFPGPVTATIGRDDVTLTPALPAADAARTSVRSPNGQWEAYVRDHNLWIRSTRTTADFALSFDASAGHTFHHDTSRDRLIGMNYEKPETPATLPEVFWSPDSKQIVALQTRLVPERRVHLTESSPSDQLQPRQHSYPYLKAGDEIPTQRPRLFAVADAHEISVDPALFATPWQLTRFRWRPDSREFSFLYNQRGHQVLRLVAVDAVTGAARTAVEERSDTFIHYSVPASYQEVLDATREVIWSSERSGWNHLYLHDLATGRLKNAITTGDWPVRSVSKVEAKQRRLWFVAGGIVPGQDPYYAHHARVNFDGTGLVVLTAGDGTHEVRWSPQREYFVDTWSRVDAPPVSVLRRGEDGALVCELETADAAELLAQRGRWPERFVAKGRDGVTAIHGIILRPADFDPARKYPVIEKIYAGPHGFFTPKAFGAHDALVDRGFIVVQVDGMGTAGRSKAFHDVCWRNLADAGFPYRIAWITAAAARYPELDLTRVGIYGTSAGGQSALGAVLFHGHFYRAAAADCGCHDNRMDKIWWNEQWMGWPVGPHYAANSNVTHAASLRGKLFLAVGELDRNVDPASTYQVANALVQAGRDFDYLVMPGAGHGVFRTPYGRKRLEDFFVNALLRRPAP